MIGRIFLTLILLVFAAEPALAAEGGGGLREFGWAWFNLLLLLGILFYVGRKHIPDLMAARRAMVKHEIDTASNLLADAEARLAEWQQKVDSLSEEVEQLRRDSSERAAAEAERIIEQAQRVAERIRSEGQAAAVREVERARVQLQAEAAEQAIAIAREILAEKTTDADRARLLAGFVEGLNMASPSSEGSGGTPL